jgi:hypothetical protein
VSLFVHHGLKGRTWDEKEIDAREQDEDDGFDAGNPVKTGKSALDSL